jgi:hypothetical protein
MTDPVTLSDIVTARAESDTWFSTYRGYIEIRPSRNYVMLLFGAGMAMTEFLGGGSDTLLWRFRAQCVGFSDRDCLGVASRMRTLFTNWRPLEDRGASWFTEEQDDAPMLRDESMPRDVRFSTLLRFRLTTTRST